MIEVTMTFETAAEAAAALAAIAAPSPAAIIKAIETPKPAPAEQPKAEAPKEQPAATPVSSPAPSPSPAPAAEVTYDDLKKAIVKLAAKSPDTMRAICTEFGVKTFAGTPADVWPKALARVEAEVAKLG